MPRIRTEPPGWTCAHTWPSWTYEGAWIHLTTTREGMSKSTNKQTNKQTNKLFSFGDLKLQTTSFFWISSWKLWFLGSLVSQEPLGQRFAGRSSGLCGAHPRRHDVGEGSRLRGPACAIRQPGGPRISLEKLKSWGKSKVYPKQFTVCWFFLHFCCLSKGQKRFLWKLRPGSLGHPLGGSKSARSGSTSVTDSRSDWGSSRCRGGIFFWFTSYENWKNTSTYLLLCFTTCFAPGLAADGFLSSAAGVTSQGRLQGPDGPSGGTTRTMAVPQKPGIKTGLVSVVFFDPTGRRFRTK